MLTMCNNYYTYQQKGNNMATKVKYAPVSQTDLTVTAPDSPSSPVAAVAQRALAQEVVKAPTISLKRKVFAVTVLGIMATATALSVYNTVKDPEKAWIILSTVAGTLTSGMGYGFYQFYKAVTTSDEDPTPAESAV